jgi:uncharacterized protein YdcH (DUF465 family)
MHSNTGTILTDVTNHYNQLVNEHHKLHTEIEHCQYYAPDDDLKTLKKKKLRLKDEIEQLKNHLNNLTK